MSGPSGQRWLTVAQVAERTGYHPQTVREALRRGQLRGSRRGHAGNWRVAEEDLQRWFDRGSNRRP